MSGQVAGSRSPATGGPVAIYRHCLGRHGPPIAQWLDHFRRLGSEQFRPSCWKQYCLSIGCTRNSIIHWHRLGEHCDPVAACGATTAYVQGGKSINDSGFVVGASDVGGWIWSANDGTLLLNSLVAPGWVISAGIQYQQQRLDSGVWVLSRSKRVCRAGSVLLFA